MTHLLDTNACIHFLRFGTISTLAVKLAAAPIGSVGLCSVIIAELIYGAYRSVQVVQTLVQVRRFCATYVSLPFSDMAAEEYGRIRDHLERLGAPIGPNDLMIAAIALANGLTVVTHDTAEFGRVPGLLMEDWQIP